MVAEVLQIPLENVSMTPADSLVTPFEFGPVGSRGTYAIGSAVINAAEDARRKLLEFASSKLGAPPEELDTVDGVVFVKGQPGEAMKWSSMGNDRTILGYGRFDPDFTMCNIMMSFVEVEVDTETGKVDLIRVVNATDVGQVDRSSRVSKGSSIGCLGSAGIDSAVFEETILDRRTGHIVNANMIDYKWRTFAELPDIENVVLETPFPSHRFHAVGVGEITTASGPSAVLMAASNAVGELALRVSGDTGQGAQGPGKGKGGLKPWRGRREPRNGQRRCEMKRFAHHTARNDQGGRAPSQGLRRKRQGSTPGVPTSSRHEGQKRASYPEAVIDIKTIEGLDYIRKDGKGLRIGALARLSDVAGSETVRAEYDLLADAVQSVASPTLRNMATLGGNLAQDVRCWYYRYPRQIGGPIVCLRKGGKILQRPRG